MNEHIKNGVVKQLAGYDTPIYLIKNNNDFSTTEYKMMGNLNSLLRCRKSSLDGNLQIVFLKNGYSPLSLLKPQINEEKLTVIIGEICDALIEINSNGFMNCSNVVFSEDMIFVNPLDWTTRLVYIPVTHTGYANSSPILELNTFFLSLTENDDLVSPQLSNAIRFFSGTSPDATLEDIKHFYKDLLQRKKVENEKEEKKPPKSKVLYAKSKDAGIEAAFRIDQPRFVIGRKKSVVDGLMPNNPSLGRAHCEIVKENNQFYVSDLGSVNGTYVNSKRLIPGERAELHDGDVLRLSNSRLLIEIREE